MLKKNACLILEKIHVKQAEGMESEIMKTGVYCWDVASQKEVKLIRVDWYRKFCSHIAMK